MFQPKSPSTKRAKSIELSAGSSESPILVTDAPRRSSALTASAPIADSGPST